MIRRIGGKPTSYAEISAWASRQRDGGRQAAQLLLNWATDDTTGLHSLPTELQDVAIITHLAEVGRGYSSSLAGEPEVHGGWQDGLERIVSLGGMRPEPLSSVDDADWLSLRCELWPDCARQQHLEEMACFLAAPDRYAQFIVREQDGRGVGFAEASIRTDYVNGTASSPVAYLEGLYVRPEARGKGAARQLVLAVSEWALAHGCTELASDTQPENLVSQAVHVQLGFVETERAVFYSKPLGPTSGS